MIDYIQQGDCLDLMKNIPDKSIDMILCDLPYGVLNKSNLNAKWDSVIPLKKHIVINDKVVYEDEYILTELKNSNKSYCYLRDEFNTKAKDGLWMQYERIIKDNGAIVLFGQEPFSSYLRMSNIKNFKYDWYWEKERLTNIAQVKKKRAGKTIETISVFYNKQCTYNPQMQKYEGKKRTNKVKNGRLGELVDSGTKKVKEYKDTGWRYPTQLLKFKRDILTNNLHPTQKPVALLEYLIKTYTNENETVLDNCMGSGSTIVACVNTNRHYIGFEMEQKYFDIAEQRIKDAKNKIEEDKLQKR